MALPSPTRATTGRFGSASFTPSAAGRPQPMPPPRRLKNDFASAHRKKLRMPADEEIASSTTTTSSGTTCETACTRASGPIGDFLASSPARRARSSRSRACLPARASRRLPASLWPALPAYRRTASVSSGSDAFGSPWIATAAG